MSGGPSTLTGGFWALSMLVQSSDAPTLLINNNAPGFAAIWRTPPPPGVALRFTDTLASPNWGNARSGTNNPESVPSTLPNRNNEVLFVTLNDGGHQWSNSADKVPFKGSDEVLKFFDAHRAISPRFREAGGAGSCGRPR